MDPQTKFTLHQLFIAIGRKFHKTAMQIEFSITGHCTITIPGLHTHTKKGIVPFSKTAPTLEKAADEIFVTGAETVREGNTCTPKCPNYSQ